MTIKYLKVKDLKEYEHNPRKNDEAVDYVVNSIRSFGFRVPLVVDADNVIVCGHTRLKAAQRIGMTTVPCVAVDELTPDQVNAYRLVDNRTQELSSWDFSKLIDELAGIDEFDMQLFGFGAAEEEDEKPATRTSNLDKGFEVDVSDFDEEHFTCECPECGFRFNG